MSQDNTAIEIETLSQNISFHIGLADLDLERGNYFIAQENLQKALDFAIKIDDKKKIGVIHTKLAKIYYTLSETEKAIVLINKALEIQRLT